MSGKRTCQECGTPLASDAADGFCPTCALEGALKLGSLAAVAAVGDTSSSLPSSAGTSGSATESDRAEFSFLSACDVPGTIGRLGQYEVFNVVGRGGMGIVFRAFDPKLHRVVAIKAMEPELASNTIAVKRFLREARAAAALSHERVITIFAVEDGFKVPFLVMEYIDGQSLQAKLNQAGALPLQEILRVGMQIAEGLSAAHRQGLVHRDIKPANILLENGVERVKITDFGLARSIDDVAGFTQTTEIIGTPNYMAPEQIQGQSIDHRSDLFALGSVLYTMCTGQPPFRAESLVAVLHRICHDTPRPISEMNPEIPRWLEAIVERLLAKCRDQRFQTANEVATLLREGLVRSSHCNEPAFTRDKPIDAEPTSHLLTRIPVFPLNRPIGVAVMLLLFSVVLVAWKLYRIQSAPAVVPFSPSKARGYQERWARYAGVPVSQTNSIGMVLRLIPPGEFQMGSQPEDAKLLEAGDWFFAGWAAQRIEFEFPWHKVTITRPYALGAKEVTVGQFRQFVARTGYKTVAERNEEGGFGWAGTGWQRSRRFDWSNPGYVQSDEHPVANLAWADANEFCRWLGKEENRVYRLPTEAEWEFACRAGTQTWFHSGDRDEGLKLVANIADEAFKQLHPEFSWARSWNDGFAFAAPVGQFAPNAFGLYDMHGNVWEWCLDSYDPDYYRHSTGTNPLCLRGQYHVFRGGGWDNYPGFCRSADRYSSHSPELRTEWAGFRVLMELNKSHQLGWQSLHRSSSYERRECS